MPRPARTVAAALSNKGFASRENHHTYFHLVVAGKKIIVSTKISHGETEIGDPLLASMARQVHLSKKQFLELVDCPMTAAAYLVELRKSKVIADPAAAPAEKTTPGSKKK